MHRARLALSVCASGRRFIRFDQRFRTDAESVVEDARRGTRRLFEAFDAAQAAAGGAGHGAAARGVIALEIAGQPAAQFDAEIAFEDLDIAGVLRRCDQTFGEGEADREIFEIGRVAIITAWVEPP